MWKRVQTTRGGRFARDIVRAALGLLHGFRGEQVSVRAAALTYISLFSLVPLLAVALGLLRLIKQKAITERVQELAHDVLAPGVREETAAFLDSFIKTASSTAVSGMGAIGLLIAAGSLVYNLEKSINSIWHVRRERPVYIRGLMYLGVLLGGPIVVGLSLAATGVFQRIVTRMNLPYSREFLWVGAVVVTMASMTALYKLTPATGVRFRSALAGGMVAGLAWDVAKHLYSEFAAVSFKLNPFYASLGALPLFMLWIYVSWLIVLMGARLAYAVQHASFRGVILDLERHPRARELIAARIAQLTTTALLDGFPAPTAKKIARSLEVPDQTLFEIVELMEQAGLLVRIKRGGLRPARPPADLTLADVAAAVGGIAALLPRSADDFAKAPEFQTVEAMFQGLDHVAIERLKHVTWDKLASKAMPSKLEFTPVEMPESRKA